jgi:hypothetical protein
MTAASTKYIATLQRALDAKEASLRQAAVEITALQAQLEAANDKLAIPKVGDGTPDAALAIGEHAFRAGWDDGFLAGNFEGTPGVASQTKDEAWGNYDPPEHIKELS